ncbi:MAG TPA: response regulator transcription factor [Chthoniobacterales bacterium]|nr:response regulator transcription factor [Chthoniobacterales bacterium]
MNRNGRSGVNLRERRRTNAHLSSGDYGGTAIRSPSKKDNVRSKSGLAVSRVGIVVVDDHRFMRELIAAMLRRHDSRYEVVAEVADAKSAIDACQRLSPDLVVLDINLPDASGIDIVPQIKKVSPHTRVLLCTAYVTDDRIVDALTSGAEGFAEKTNTWRDFAEAIDRVLGGEHYFCARPSAAFANAAPAIGKGLAPASTAGLSPREKEILALIAEGATSKEIASKLGISVATVETHRRRLMAKLHIRNVAGLVVFAFRAGLIRLQR